MAKKLEFVSPYSCDECVRHLQALAAQGPFYITKGKGIFRSGDELAMGRLTTSAGPDQVRFQLCGHAYPSPRRKAAWIGINANGALEPQGASTRVTMDIEPSPLSKAIGGLVLFVLAALLLIATLLKAYDLEQFIKINIAVLFLFIMIYILYVRT